MRPNIVINFKCAKCGRELEFDENNLNLKTGLLTGRELPIVIAIGPCYYCSQLDNMLKNKLISAFNETLNTFNESAKSKIEPPKERK